MSEVKTFQIKLTDHTVTIDYSTRVDGDDLFLKSINASSDKNQDLIKSYIDLISNRAVAQLDRVSVREWDHFIRQTTDIPSFDYYSDWHYQVLKIGEKIKENELHKKSKEEVIIDERVHSDFSLMGMAEIIELAEEVYGNIIHNYSLEHNLEIQYTDFDCDKLILHLESKIINNKQMQELGQLVLQKTNNKFSILFN